MLNKTLAWVILFLVSTGSIFAQSAPENWFNLDKKSDKIWGVSTEKAYELLKDKTSVTVVVGILDSGVDEDHEDLKNVMWVNKNEIADNNVDDDNNGYVDDIYGWNFIGGKNGNVEQDSYELTRVYKKLSAKFETMTEATMTDSEKKEYGEFLKLKVDFLQKSIQAKAMFQTLSKSKKRFDDIEAAIGKGENITLDDLKNYKASSSVEATVIEKLTTYLAAGEKYATLKADFMEAYNHYDKEANFGYNIDFDPRSIVGDNYDDPNDNHYGNNDVTGPDASHGTHVAGIVAAQRDNALGVKGVANNVKIMSVRCVPDGDERDKDVANAIRYAVDNGAKVVNMSFGKGFSWDKTMVDAAVKYAESKDVLLVHGAGNDAKNIDSNINYPNPYYAIDNRRAENWLEVGASSWNTGKQRLGNFSNYGKKKVDIFAPGVAIYSTIPNSKYASFNGTSMASPCAAGVAALIRSYFPDLTAAQVRTILIKSVTKMKGKTYLPGTKKAVKLKSICVSGGVINAAKAIKLADKLSKY
jgi:cell wall-associated protease